MAASAYHYILRLSLATIVRLDVQTAPSPFVVSVMRGVADEKVSVGAPALIQVLLVKFHAAIRIIPNACVVGIEVFWRPYVESLDVRQTEQDR